MMIGMLHVLPKEALCSMPVDKDAAWAWRHACVCFQLNWTQQRQNWKNNVVEDDYDDHDINNERLVCNTSRARVTVAANLSLQIHSLVVLPLYCFPLIHPQSVGYETISSPTLTYDRRRVEDTTLMSRMFSTILEAVRLNETLHRQRDSNINGFDRLNECIRYAIVRLRSNKKRNDWTKTCRYVHAFLVCCVYNDSHMTRTMSPRPRGQRAWPILGEREREKKPKRVRIRMCIQTKQTQARHYTSNAIQ